MAQLSHPGLGLGLCLTLLAASPAFADDTAAGASASVRLDGQGRTLASQLTTAEAQDNLETRLSLALGAGSATPGAASASGELKRWDDLQVAAAPLWTGRPLQLSLEAASGLSQPADGGYRTDASARAKAAITPHPALSFDLTGEVAQSDAALGQSGAVQVSRVSDAVVAGVQWKPLPGMSLKASQRLEDADVVWRGRSASQAVAAVDLPAVELAARPWNGADLNIAYGRTASNFDAGRFAAIAANSQADPTLLGRAYRPDQAWRLAVTAVHQIGAAKLKLGLSDSQLITSQEMGAAAPTLVAGGRRTDMSLGFEWPFQLADRVATLMGDWTQRASSLRDPLTGTLRPLSGEAAYDGRLDLALASLDRRWSWGLGAHLTGPSADFSASRVRQVGALSSLSSFVEMRADNTALRLQVDNLLNDAPSVLDMNYLRDRSSGQILSQDHSALDSSALRLSVTLSRRI